MNFENWYKNYCDTTSTTGPHQVAKESWDACKKEVLKSINKHITTWTKHADDSSGIFEWEEKTIFNPENLIKDVKEL